MAKKEARIELKAIEQIGDEVSLTFHTYARTHPEKPIREIGVLSIVVEGSLEGGRTQVQNLIHSARIELMNLAHELFEILKEKTSES